MAIVNLTPENFEAEVLQASGKVLVDFWAPWCGPCRMLGPIIEEIANDPPEGVKVCKLNIDEAPELAARYGVMSIPTVAVFAEGELAQKSVGVRPKQFILGLLG